ncbi:MAG: response regulator [Alphaproteobacteria bacterium]
MNASRPHVLVVDDDRRLRELLRKYLSENGYLVSTARDAADARAKLESLSFDLLVIDVMMPGENGLDLTESLRRDSRIPILILTAMGEVDDRIAGLERGADDYLPKPFEPRELLLRIGTVLRRSEVPADTPAGVRLGPFYFDIDRGELRRNGEVVPLTSSEASLLRVLALNPRMTLSRDRLSREGGVGGNRRNVDVQVTRLRRKIEPNPKIPRYLQTVWGEGYVLRPD